MFRKPTLPRKIVAVFMAGSLVIAPALVAPGCGANAFMGMEDYQRELAWSVGTLALALLADRRPELFGFPVDDEPTPGDPVAGRDGLHCWDRNGDGLADPDEDMNHDGIVTALDCRGPAGVVGAAGADGRDGEDGAGGARGPTGPAGPSGSMGPAGPSGPAGADGRSCWDINGDGVGEETEDVDGDGFFTALDCRGRDGADGAPGPTGPMGPAGPSGPAGAAGRSCWDINGDGVGEETEDVDGDGFFTALDCRGRDGVDGRDGANGQDGADGVDGASCWDLNGNGARDAEEDVNLDTIVDALDCRGADGRDGRDGKDGRDGVDGLNCWDLNGNGVGDPAEDRNRDNLFTALDCQGTGGGIDGLHCWDLNGNGVADPEEDIDADGFVTVLDCRGTGGADGQDGQDGADGANGVSCWDLDGDGLADPGEDFNGDGFFTALDCRGADGDDGADGLHCWDLNGDGIGDPDEDTDGDGRFTALDCRPTDGVEPPLTTIFFDILVDEFFTAGNGSYQSVPIGGMVEPGLIEEPSLGPAKVIAYRMAVPQYYSDDGIGNPGGVQNTVVMRLFFWREGPIEDCFVVRLDAFRTRHGEGFTPYGAVRYLKFDDPPLPNPGGTTVVIDLPLNNVDDDPASGLCFPADLRVSDFIAFELNILPDANMDPDVAYTLMGVEFFEAPPSAFRVEHATVFKSAEDVDCSFVLECRNDHDCNDGEFCNGVEHCAPDGTCRPGTPPCLPNLACDEAQNLCVGCDVPVPDNRSAVCHVSDDHPGLRHTVIVGNASVEAHLAHGDTLGPCPEDCPEDP